MFDLVTYRENVRLHDIQVKNVQLSDITADMFEFSDINEKCSV